VLILKAQVNHFYHLDMDLRTEVKVLREDMDKRFEQIVAQMDKRFEQVDKHFEQIVAQMDKRFEVLTSRVDHFMIWSFATTVTVGGVVIAAMRFLK
jgi:hypothetical protein